MERRLKYLKEGGFSFIKLALPNFKTNFKHFYCLVVCMCLCMRMHMCVQCPDAHVRIPVEAKGVGFLGARVIGT